ncbi:efflux RND transporter periplasmic adaptor subunit [Acetobacteraceae bacterium H6797]|nr:efflux RND transporter periplasmic adaptor subunit [Acetobacteraceae bacterium H6797]
MSDPALPKATGDNGATKRRLLPRLLLLACLGGLGTLLWFATRPPPLLVQGEVSADRVDVSPRVSGRVREITVEAGDDLRQRQVIAQLENPQLATALIAAEAAVAVARADFDRVSSTRPETIAARRADVAAAQADVTLYLDAYGRQAQLIRTGNTPQARLDEAARNLENARRRQEAAAATLQLAIAGASAEERALAAAQLRQAEAALGQRQADIAELTIRSPIDGQVTSRIAEPGENFSPGAPLVSLIALDRLWITFNLREDLLRGLVIGSRITVTVPALGGQKIPLRVTMINVQGQFATWRATRATGDFDLRSFEVRAEPLAPMPGLRPGMSAIARWEAKGAAR